MTAKIFIDGEVGTTGLQIRARLAERDDLRFLSLTEDNRKNLGARKALLNEADIAILCLPDAAARDAALMIENEHTKVIDASSAHRVADGWAYGFPEYEPGQRDIIASAKRVSNPGCYAISSVSIVHPLVKSGLLPADWPVMINAVSGYSGGGRQLIEAFEDEKSPDFTQSAFFNYGLTLTHKHIPEITKWGGLEHPPLFTPSVGRYRQGMVVQLPLQLWSLPGTPKPEDVQKVLADHYSGSQFVTVPEISDIADMSRLDPESLNGTNELRLHVFANEDNQQVLIAAILDNLGKGASGQTVQNLNIMMGVPEDTGLQSDEVLPVFYEEAS
jgi:N-acetyl-gamma-glutamyl-phosphate reductase